MTDPYTEVQDLMKYFEWAHLPEHLQTISKPFCYLAMEVAGRVPEQATIYQTRDCLRSLLTAKDCAVRAAL